MPKSPSYEKCPCGEECCRLDDSPSEVCWGKVAIINSYVLYNEKGEAYDSVVVHTCEGHASPEEEYIPEVPDVK